MSAVCYCGRLECPASMHDARYCLNHAVEALAAVTRERDEARALAAQPCDGIGCPHGEEAVRLHKDAARLREALESMKHLLGWFWDEGMLDIHDEDCPHDDTCECDAAGQFNEAHNMARAALKETKP